MSAHPRYRLFSSIALTTALSLNACLSDGDGDGTSGQGGAGGRAGSSGSSSAGTNGAGGGNGGNAGTTNGAAGDGGAGMGGGDGGSGGDSGSSGDGGSGGVAGDGGSGGVAGDGGSSGAAGDGGAAGNGGAAGDGGAGGQGGGASGSAGSGGTGGTSGAGGTGGVGGGAGQGGGAGAGGGGPGLCHATPGPDDARRAVVVSLDAFTGGTTFELFWLETDGALTRPGVTFELGEAEFDGRISFTPDGQLGATVIVDPVSNEGRIAVFRIDGDAVTVTEPSYALTDFDPRRVIVDPSGAFVWALDTNRFGAVVAVPLDCEGKLGTQGLSEPATLPRALSFVPGAPERAVLASRAGPAFPGTPLSPATFRLFETEGGVPTPVAGISAYGNDDEDGSITGFGLTPDGKYAIAVEDNLFPSAPSHNNRVSVAAVGKGLLERVQIFTYVPPTPGSKKLEAPFDLITSPFNNAALISAGLGSTDAIWRLSYDPSQTAAPFAFTGEVAYASGPQLPGTMVGATRGALKGRVLVVEVQGLRRLQFLPDGGVVDHGIFAVEKAVGAIGIQP